MQSDGLEAVGSGANTRSDGLEKVALFGVVLLLGAVFTVLVVPPADQYEISLYDVYPIYFWSLVIGAMTVGAVVIVASATRSGDETWIFGFLLMAVTNALVLLIPHIRGYLMYGRADALTHIGYVHDILRTGTLGGNIYPPTHLLVGVVTSATGLELTTVAMAIPVVFSGIYFGTMFSLLVTLFDSREQVLFGLPFVMLPVLGIAHVHLRPFDLSVMLVPLVLYLFVKGRHHATIAVRVAFVVVLLVTVLYHPLTALFLVFVLVLYVGSRYLPEIKQQYFTPTNSVSLSAVVSLVWYLSFAGIILRFNRIYNTLFGVEEGRPPVDTYTSTMEQTTIALIDLVRVATLRFGTEFLLFGLGFAFLLVASILYYRGEYTPTAYTVMLGGALVVFSFLGLGFLFFDFIVPQERPFQIAKLGAVVLAGQLFYLLWKYGDWSNRRSGIHTGFVVSLGVVLLVVISVAMFALYPSPMASKYNHQVTEMEVEGIEWLTEHGTDNTEVREFGFGYRRFHDAQAGRQAAPPHTTAPLPPHFNYTEREFVGENYEDDSYLVLTQRGRVLYPKTFPDYRSKWRYTPRDFARLERDVTVARVYDNGGFTAYTIHGRQGADATA